MGGRWSGDGGRRGEFGSQGTHEAVEEAAYGLTQCSRLFDAAGFDVSESLGQEKLGFHFT